MWNNPQQLNIAAGAITGAAIVLLLTTALVAAMRSPLLPVREVVLTSAPRHVSRDALERALRERISGNFFALDLAAMRSALERLAWVRRVELRRIWPDRVEVMLEEHEALARWGDRALINIQGERFEAEEAPGGLPLLDGPEGSEREVAARYRSFAATVAPLGSEVERVVLSARYAWQISLANGLRIMLGRDSLADPVERRLARFVAAVPMTLGRMNRRNEYVDLRYPNGFALRVPELAQAAAPTRR